ncbi:MAG: tRNA lysidine(34) synthetase TilS [Sphingobium sp.]|nr:tRNA lysidine(34) synthetase TilS [Sphingobium sp.]
MRLIGERTAHDTRLCIAVSGGPDSMALLFLAVQAFPAQVVAATVDHGLRPAARAEAEMVGRWCLTQGVKHAILTPSTPITGSIQASARSVRYELLHHWREEQGADWLLTAHHADDQCETMMMRLNRSSGVSGLAAIRGVNGAVLRPLLSWRRTELAAIVDEQALPHVYDPSNDDVRFDRVAMRKNLAGADWLDPIAIARSAAACGDAEEALGWMADDLAGRYLSRDDGAIILQKHDFPREMQRRLLIKMLLMADTGRAPPRGDALDQLLIQLTEGKRAMMGNWLFEGGDSWCLRAAPPRSVR